MISGDNNLLHFYHERIDYLRSSGMVVVDSAKLLIPLLYVALILYPAVFHRDFSSSIPGGLMAIPSYYYVNRETKIVKGRGSPSGVKLDMSVQENLVSLMKIQNLTIVYFCFALALSLASYVSQFFDVAFPVAIISFLVAGAIITLASIYSTEPLLRFIFSKSKNMKGDVRRLTPYLLWLLLISAAVGGPLVRDYIRLEVSFLGVELSVIGILVTFLGSIGYGFCVVWATFSIIRDRKIVSNIFLVKK